MYLWDSGLHQVLSWLSDYTWVSSDESSVLQRTEFRAHLQMHLDTAGSWELCRDTLSALSPFSSSGSV